MERSFKRRSFALKDELSYRLCQAAQIDVGGVEYIVDQRDGSLLYYDINALSNFVADATVTGSRFSSVG